MPPKKPAKIKLTQEAQDRRTFNRKRGGQHVILAEIVEPVVTDSMCEAEKMNAAFDSLDNISLELFNKDGVRVKFDGNRHVVHENQPPENWRPSQHVELLGSWGNRNKPHKKMQLIDPEKKARKKVNVQNESVHEQLFASIRSFDLKAVEEKCQSPKSFRIFAAPKPRNDRLSFFSYTPIKGRNNVNTCFTPGSFMSPMIGKPQMASTPMEKMVMRRSERHPVFDFDDLDEENKSSTECHTAIEPNESKAEKSFRKAETSISDILETSTKKRQRTASPDVRRTLQPQQSQLLRESRLSVLTTASIDSLLDDMTLDVCDEVSNTLLDSRNVPTGMTIVNEDASIAVFYLADLSLNTTHLSPISQLLHIAGQSEVETWKDVPKGAFTAKNVVKLGEGSYGEVYSTVWNGMPVAIKVVAFELDEENRQFDGEYNGDKMPLADVVIPELVVMKELSALRNMDNEDATPNFINMISAKIVRGAYPAGLKSAWNGYSKESENTPPTAYATKNQHFMLFVTENGGVALEDFVLGGEQELRSILVQLILSMHVAENSLQFEHRDLHLGNVLIDRNGVERLEYKVHGHSVSVNTHGVKANIIDFTLSRIKKEGTYVFYDLDNDPFIFEGQGNPQFDVYRKMRDEKIGSWKDFHIRTNLMWIEYLAKAMLDSETISPAGLFSEERKTELRSLFDRLGRFQSCRDSLLDPEFFDVFYKGFL